VTELAKGFLIDQMLPARLAEALRRSFPETIHGGGVGLSGRPDHKIAEFADQNDLAVMTKDRDFERIMESGAPRKTVWLSVGNIGNRELIDIVTAREEELSRFLAGNERLLLFLRPQ
jgi:predicted nuclease of predicted toxin-antitoxin system